MNSRITVREGDSRELILELPENCLDAVVSDPPYALESIVKRFGGTNAAPAIDRDGVFKRASSGFMGQKWDTSEVAHDPGFWRHVYHALKPGGHVLAFSATRTAWRMGAALHAAGFEIRDQLSWLYGSGFPKSHDAAQSIEKLLTTGKARRPDRELGGLSRNRFSGSEDGTLIANTGGKVPITTPEAAAWEGWGTALKPACEPIVLARKPLDGTVAANVLRWSCGALNIEESRVPVDARLDARDLARETTRAPRAEAENGHAWGMNANSGGVTDILDANGRFPANLLHDGSDEVLEAFGIEDGVSVARYFSTFPWTHEDDYFVGGQRFMYAPKAGEDDRMGSVHPTVKPVALKAWLTRLVCRPGGLILDPFAGSGTTGQGAMRVGVNSLLFERDAAFAEDCRRRARYAHGELALDAALLARVDDEVKRGDDLPLFGGG